MNTQQITITPLNESQETRELLHSMKRGSRRAQTRQTIESRQSEYSYAFAYSQARWQ